MAATDYTVGWICTTVPELEAATAFLEEEHKPKHSLADKGILFVLGKVGNHNVVIGSTTLQVYGLANASGVATAMLESFPSLRVAFLVGIGSGVPNRLADIHLGDVVVGFPDAKHDSVIRCTLQHCTSDTVEVSVKSSSLHSVPDCVRENFNSLQYGRGRCKALLERSIEQAFVRNPRLRPEFERPTSDLQKTDQTTKNMSTNASAPNLFADPSAILDEDWETNAVQYSTIACASSLTRRLLIEHELTAQHNILCFETEAFNTSQKFPCIVIRGISSLAVSRQFEGDRAWQNYAAMAASAYTAHLLHEIPATKISAAKPISRDLLKQQRPVKGSGSVLENNSWRRSILRKAKGASSKFRLVQRTPFRVDDHLVNDGFQESCLHSLKEGIDSNLRDGYIYSILQSASFSGHRSLVDDMLRYGPNIIAKDDYFGTPLEIAAATGNVEIVRKLLSTLDVSNIEASSAGGAVFLSVLHGHETIVQLLDGINLESKDSFYGDALQVAVAKGHTNIVRWLLGAGVSTNEQGGVYGNALQAAALHNNVESVQLLLKYGANVDIEGGYYGTALEVATLQNNIAVVRILLERGASLSLYNDLHTSSLQIALKLQNYDILELLLQHVDSLPGNFVEYAILTASEDHKHNVIHLLSNVWHDVDTQSLAFEVAQSVFRVEGWHDNLRRLVSRGAETKRRPESENVFEWSPYKKIEPSKTAATPNRKDGSQSVDETKDQTPRKLNLARAEKLANLAAINLALKSRGLHRDTFTLHIQLSSELAQFYQDQGLSEDEFLRLITLSGMPNCAQAASCKDFVEQVWGPDGTELLQAFVHYLSKQYIDMEVNLPSGAYVAITQLAYGDSVASIRAPQRKVESIQKQFEWFASIFRKGSTEGLAVVSVDLHILCMREGIRYCKMKPMMNEAIRMVGTRIATEGPPSCWYRLFHGTILACGFAIAERGQGKGVEIPFELMVNMAGVAAIVPRPGGSFFLTGHLVTLFPTARLQDGIQWHSVSNDKMEELANISVAPDEISSMSVGDFCSYRTFLGYYEKADVLLGTKTYTETNHVTDCGLDVAGRRIELIGEGTYSLGVSIKGIVNGNVGGKWVLSRDHEVCLTEYRDYFDRLQEAQRQPLIAYDTSKATGWLVSELSMALQLALTYLNSPAAQLRYLLQNEEADECEIPTNLPYALPCADGGSAALSVCQRRENHLLKLWKDAQGEQKQFGNFLEDVLKELGALKTAIKVQRISSGLCVWPLAKEGLRGFDFHSLATRRQGVQHRELQSTGNKASWWGLQHVHGMLVIFGAGFGTVISPSGKTSFPREQPAPYQARLLVASKPCVEALLKEKSGRLYFGTLVWNQPRKDLKECKKGCDGSSCLSIQHLGARPYDPPPKNSIFNTSDAIVFGDVNSYHAVLRSDTISQTWSFARLTLNRNT